MSGSITGGTVHFLKRIKTGDYEHAEASASINFSVDEGEDHVSTVALARQTALSVVYTSLGLKAPAGGAAVIVETTAAAGDESKDAVAARKGRGIAKGKPPAPPTTPKNEEPAFDPLAEGAGSSSQASTEGSSEADGEFDPLAGSAGSNGGNDGSDVKSQDTPLVTDDDDAALFSAEAEVIDDAKLLGEITAKNSETRNTPAIRKLIGKYTPADGKPHTAKEVPVADRAAFLIELGNIPSV